MSTLYDNCFNHITDPVQRNSGRQQWLQMVEGGLSISDLRVLLDQYSDFRLAVEEFVKQGGLLLLYQHGLTEVVNTLPEFKKIFYEKAALESTSRDELTEIAHTFPDLNFIVKEQLKYLDRKEQIEQIKKQEAERRRRDINEMYDKFYPEIEQYVSQQVDEILKYERGIDSLESQLYYSWSNFPRNYTDSRTGKKYFLDEEAGEFFYEKLKGKFKNRLGGQGFLHGIDVVANVFSLSPEIEERQMEQIAYWESVNRGVSIGDSYTENIAH